MLLPLVYSINLFIYESLYEGDNYFLRLTCDNIDDKTMEVMCMISSAVAYIIKNFIEEGNLIDTHKVKMNGKVGSISATKKVTFLLLLLFYWPPYRVV